MSAAVLTFPLRSALSVIIIVVNNAATVTDLITGCQCVRERWKLCVPRGSLSPADRPHKSKAALDQYVSNNDRLVPDKRLQHTGHLDAPGTLRFTRLLLPSAGLCPRRLSFYVALA